MWNLDKAKRGKPPEKGQQDTRSEAWRLTCEKSNYGPRPEPLHLDWDADGEGRRWKVAGAWDTNSDQPMSATAKRNGYDRTR